MTVAARAALEIKRIKNELANLTHRNTLLLNELDKAKRTITALESKSTVTQNPTPYSIETGNLILDDLFRYYNDDCFAEFSQDTFDLAVQIKEISPKAYYLLSSKLPFPTPALIDKLFKEAISRIPDQLLDVNNVTSLVDLWKKKTPYYNKRID